MTTPARWPRRLRNKKADMIVDQTKVTQHQRSSGPSTTSQRKRRRMILICKVHWRKEGRRNSREELRTRQSTRWHPFLKERAVQNIKDLKPHCALCYVQTPKTIAFALKCTLVPLATLHWDSFKRSISDSLTCLMKFSRYSPSQTPTLLPLFCNSFKSILDVDILFWHPSWELGKATLLW